MEEEKKIKNKKNNKMSAILNEKLWKFNINIFCLNVLIKVFLTLRPRLHRRRKHFCPFIHEKQNFFFIHRH